MQDNIVDMTSLMKYVLNNINQLPMYCYAEENPVINHDFRTSIEQIHEVPFVLPKKTLYRDNLQEELLKPPPGFLPLNSFDILKNASSYSKVETATNPFLDDQLPDIISIDFAKQIFAHTWKENTQLQIKLSRILYDLLECSSIKKCIFQNYIIKQRQINNILKDIEKKLISSIVDVSDGDRSTSGSVNETTVFDDDSNDEFIALNIASNLLNLIDDDRSTNQDTLLNSVCHNLNDFPCKKDQAQSIEEFSSHISFQSPSTNHKSMIFDNYEVATSLSFQETDHKNTNKSSMESVSPLTPIVGDSSNNSNNNDSSSSSSFFSVKAGKHNVHKETNPFKRSMSRESKDQESEQKVNNYNPNSTDILAINLQNHTSNVECINIDPKIDALFL